MAIVLAPRPRVPADLGEGPLARDCSSGVIHQSLRPMRCPCSPSRVACGSLRRNSCRVEDDRDQAQAQQVRGGESAPHRPAQRPDRGPRCAIEPQLCAPEKSGGRSGPGEQPEARTVNTPAHRLPQPAISPRQRAARRAAPACWSWTTTRTCWVALCRCELTSVGYPGDCGDLGRIGADHNWRSNTRSSC